MNLRFKKVENHSKLVITVCMRLRCICGFFIGGFCDFEMDFCGWVNSRPPQSGVDWDWLSAENEGVFVPGRDHTTNSALGQQPYVYFKYKSNRIM